METVIRFLLQAVLALLSGLVILFQLRLAFLFVILLIIIRKRWQVNALQSDEATVVLSLPVRKEGHA